MVSNPTLTYTASSGWNTSTTTSYTNWITLPPAASSATSVTWGPPGQTWVNVDAVELIPDKLPAGQRTLGLPDGSKLHIDDLGNYRIEDKDAKVTYQANRMREFSPHLNASDMLAAFVKFVGSLGVRQSEVLGLPIELFINWLVIEAAERDQDLVPSDVVRVEAHPAIVAARRPKCLACGRFVPRLYHRNRFPFCRPEHAVRYMEKKQLCIA